MTRKNATFSTEEKSELDIYMALEHVMWLAKAKARSQLAG